MAESTLSLKLSDFTSDCGFFLGFGRGADAGETAWTTAQSNAITATVKAGVRQFYFPPPLPGEKTSYEWSFLKPVASLALLTGSNTVELPDDFAGFIGQLTLAQGDSVIPMPFPITGESQIRAAFASAPDATGCPRMAAVSPKKGMSTLTGQRFELLVYPNAEVDYTIRGTYYILPDFLTGAKPYCYGGAEHAETIRESCLMQAEKDLDDGSGVHSLEFVKKLAGSISMDRRKQPQLLGYCGDRSDYRDRRMSPNPGWWGHVLVNGVQY